METFEKKAWVARDSDGAIYLFLEKPTKVEWKGIWEARAAEDSASLIQLPIAAFRNVFWDDAEPLEVDITIKQNNE